jgi:hypothetical protein
LLIALRLVGETLFPTREEDPDPFESYCAHRGMVGFAASALGLVTGLGPGAVADGASGEFMEALAQELRAGVAKVDARFFASLFTAGSAHRSDATQGGKFDWVVEPLPIGAKGG